MQPALKAGQTFVAKVAAPGTDEPTPGDVVVFRNRRRGVLPAVSR